MVFLVCLFLLKKLCHEMDLKTEKRLKPVFRIRIRIGYAFDWLPGSGSAFGMRIQIRIEEE
jgi:hypothetical protein